MGRPAFHFAVWLLAVFLMVAGTKRVWAGTAADPPSETGERAAEEPETRKDPTVKVSWGGHLKLRAGVSWADRGSIWEALAGLGPLYDGFVETRIKNDLFFGEWGRLETHYELIHAVGDIREARGLFGDLAGGLFGTGQGRVPEDDTRLFDLTEVLDSSPRHDLYHRLDRLALSFSPSWGNVRLGRQAVTWGNGLLFNPMDLFNPFSPTDIERDYKIGDDMLHVQIAAGVTGDVQWLAVPRRDPQTGDLETGRSSLAAKWHFGFGSYEGDLMISRHFDEWVAGFGLTGYLGGAVWRADLTWTKLNEDGPGPDDYVTAVVNADVSWVWWQKNFYGLLEVYYHGLADDDPLVSLARPALAERLARGEVFVLNRAYAAGLVSMELHPLVNVFLTGIHNVKDGSGSLQPRLVRGLTQNMELLMGANINYGPGNSEFHGIDLPGSDLDTRSPEGFILWLSYYF